MCSDEEKDKAKAEKKRLKTEYKAEKARLKAGGGPGKTKDASSPPREPIVQVVVPPQEPVRWYKNPNWIRAIVATVTLVVMVITLIVTIL